MVNKAGGRAADAVIGTVEVAKIFLISVSSVVFNLLARLFFLVGVASYIFGLASGSKY